MFLNCQMYLLNLNFLYFHSNPQFHFFHYFQKNPMYRSLQKFLNYQNFLVWFVPMYPNYHSNQEHHFDQKFQNYLRFRLLQRYQNYRLFP
jgi:hypothetical protein